MRGITARGKKAETEQNIMGVECSLFYQAKTGERETRILEPWKAGFTAEIKQPETTALQEQRTFTLYHVPGAWLSPARES